MKLLQRMVVSVSAFLALTTSLVAQGTYTWSRPVQYNYAIGGDSGREAVAAAVFNNTVFMVYTSRTLASNGNYYMYIATGDGTSFNAPRQLVTQSGAALAVSNPSLLSYNNKLWLAYNSTGGIANLVSSSDGVTWGQISQLPTPSVDYSPSLGTDGTSLYIGLRNHSDFHLELCIRNSQGQLSCAEPGNYAMNFNPGLGYTSGQGGLYIAFETQDNSHAILYYTYSNGQLSAVNTSASSDATSAAPALVNLSGVLVMGFRANDGGHGFYTKNLNYANSWAASNYSGYGIGGAPALVSGNLSGRVTLFCLYVANDSSHTMYAMHS